LAPSPPRQTFDTKQDASAATGLNSDHSAKLPPCLQPTHILTE
jgi:hypothetical protein